MSAIAKSIALCLSILACLTSAQVCQPGDYCMCTNNPGVCHLTKKPCSCPGPGPPPPAPPSTFQQLHCTDKNCKTDCTLYTYPMNKCLVLAGGGSNIAATCDASGITEISFTESNCQGTGKSYSMPSGQCLQSTTGVSFINICAAGYVDAVALKLYNTSVPMMTPERVQPISVTEDEGFSAGPSKCPTGDMFCENHVSKSSYCKYWQKGPGVSVCQGSTTPCQCSCKGDAFCHAKVGPSSYCKYWEKGAGRVCQYSKVPCNCK